LVEYNVDGIVVDEESKQPIPGATVFVELLFATEEKKEPYKITTNALGKFVIRDSILKKYAYTA